MVGMDWRLEAGCRGRWKLFDMAGGPASVPANKVAREWAHELCCRCPVWRDCLLDALVTDDDGYRAGTTAHYRNHHRHSARARTQPPDRMGAGVG